MYDSSLDESPHHVRSVSLPSKTNPNISRIDEALRKLKAWESSAISSKVENACIGLSSLGDLYKCVEDLIRLPLTQQGLVRHQNEKWVEDVLDGFVRLIDVCGTARDIMTQMKENAGELRSVLRRRAEESCKEEKVEAYVSCKKKLNKCLNKCVEDLKKLDKKLVSAPLLVQDNQNTHLEMVVKNLREVRASTVSVFQYSVMAFVSEQKNTKWGLVSKLVQKGPAKSDDEPDVVECVDIALRSLFRRVSSKADEAKNVQLVQKRLEELEDGIEGVEVGLECISRRLIQTRVSLLNIFTQ
ncbi:hypothetical protein C5167_010565 [Papaver somniferum]|uniref:Uncharacterized protein n=1 Tax=Papaver somniferum TaxID=3469 RepID=A0A4Y7K3F9_PAPSO|nr:uncharacterized protein LOC113289099 [Papaver somniferum]RZC66882.1 hypothetical protein C5167_010565 [Papaver somniferum]